MPCARSVATNVVEILARADLRVERVVIDDVVAVHAAGARAEIGRAVDVADAERGEVGHERGRVLEREVCVELQAIGGARNDRAARAAQRSRASGNVGGRAQRIRRRALPAAVNQRPACALQQPGHAPRLELLRCHGSADVGMRREDHAPRRAADHRHGVVARGSRCRCSDAAVADTPVHRERAAVFAA